MLQSLGNTGASAVRAASVTRDSYPEVTGVMDQASNVDVHLMYLIVPVLTFQKQSQ